MAQNNSINFLKDRKSLYTGLAVQPNTIFFGDILDDSDFTFIAPDANDVEGFYYTNELKVGGTVYGANYSDAISKLAKRQKTYVVIGDTGLDSNIWECKIPDMTGTTLKDKTVIIYQLRKNNTEVDDITGLPKPAIIRVLNKNNMLVGDYELLINQDKAVDTQYKSGDCFLMIFSNNHFHTLSQAGKLTVDELAAKDINVKNVYITASQGHLVVYGMSQLDNAKIGSSSITSAQISDAVISTVTANNAKLQDLKVDNGTVTTININSGIISELVVSNDATISNLKVLENIDTTNIKATNAELKSIDSSNIASTSIDVSNLSASTANIIFQTSNTIHATNLNVNNNATLNQVTISSAKFTQGSFNSINVSNLSVASISGNVKMDSLDLNSLNLETATIKNLVATNATISTVVSTILTTTDVSVNNGSFNVLHVNSLVAEHGAGGAGLDGVIDVASIKTLHNIYTANMHDVNIDNNLSVNNNVNIGNSLVCAGNAFFHNITANGSIQAYDISVQNASIEIIKNDLSVHGNLSTGYSIFAHDIYSSSAHVNTLISTFATVTNLTSSDVSINNQLKVNSIICNNDIFARNLSLSGILAFSSISGSIADISNGYIANATINDASILKSTVKTLSVDDKIDAINGSITSLTSTSAKIHTLTITKNLDVKDISAGVLTLYHSIYSPTGVFDNVHVNNTINGFLPNYIQSINAINDANISNIVDFRVVPVTSIINAETNETQTLYRTIEASIASISYQSNAGATNTLDGGQFVIGTNSYNIKVNNSVNTSNFTSHANSIGSLNNSISSVISSIGSANNSIGTLASSIDSIIQSIGTLSAISSNISNESSTINSLFVDYIGGKTSSISSIYINKNVSINSVLYLKDINLETTTINGATRSIPSIQTKIYELDTSIKDLKTKTSDLDTSIVNIKSSFGSYAKGISTSVLTTGNNFIQVGTTLDANKKIPISIGSFGVSTVSNSGIKIATISLNGQSTELYANTSGINAVIGSINSRIDDVAAVAGGNTIVTIPINAASSTAIGGIKAYGETGSITTTSANNTYQTIQLSIGSNGVATGVIRNDNTTYGAASKSSEGLIKAGVDGSNGCIAVTSTSPGYQTIALSIGTDGIASGQIRDTNTTYGNASSDKAGLIKVGTGNIIVNSFDNNTQSISLSINSNGVATGTIKNTNTTYDEEKFGHVNIFNGATQNKAYFVGAIQSTGTVYSLGANTAIYSDHNSLIINTNLRVKDVSCDYLYIPTPHTDNIQEGIEISNGQIEGVKLLSTDSFGCSNGTINSDAKIGKNLTVGSNVSIVGNCTGANFYASSDSVLKTNIRKVDNSVSTIIPSVYQFNWKDDSSNQVVYGFIAQDLEQKSLGHLVSQDPETHIRSVNYNSAFALAISQLQESAAKSSEMIEKLAVRLAIVEQELENLKK